MSLLDFLGLGFLRRKEKLPREVEIELLQLDSQIMVKGRVNERALKDYRQAVKLAGRSYSGVKAYKDSLFDYESRLRKNEGDNKKPLK